ncbi:hypothetical protein [Salinarchaeum laminariae]|uniref:hypothetical protein n=1 Tax=Salinarchaeum laminariae TaxID=869888 RepID=UPI0020BE9783|nr:hypothetical protein [Salinarchaeum laminariae]
MTGVILADYCRKLGQDAERVVTVVALGTGRFHREYRATYCDQQPAADWYAMATNRC